MIYNEKGLLELIKGIDFSGVDIEMGEYGFSYDKSEDEYYIEDEGYEEEEVEFYNKLINSNIAAIEVVEHGDVPSGDAGCNDDFDMVVEVKLEDNREFYFKIYGGYYNDGELSGGSWKQVKKKKVTTYIYE